MKRSLTLTMLFIVASIYAICGNRLHTFLSQNGTVYFIEDKKLNALDGSISKFMYDVTYPEIKDSVTINFTILSKSPSDVTALTFRNKDAEVRATDVELLYHETKGKKYTIRTTSKMAFADFKGLMTSDHPLLIEIRQGDSVVSTATYNDSQWKKEKLILQSIFYTINK